MPSRWRVIVRGSTSIFELRFEGLTRARATEIRKRMAANRSQVAIEPDDELPDVVNDARPNHRTLRQNRPLAPDFAAG